MKQQIITITTDKKTFENWLDILNYWAEHIQDLGERYDDMWEMYNKYEKIIDELYNLTKKGE